MSANVYILPHLSKKSKYYLRIFHEKFVNHLKRELGFDNGYFDNFGFSLSNSNLSAECLGCQTRSDSPQSSSTIGGSVAVPDIFVGFKKPSLSVDRGHSLSSLHLPQAALASLPHGNDTCSSNSNLSSCLVQRRRARIYPCR